MKNVLWVIPVLEGKTQEIRDYCTALETSRRAEYEASEKEIGISRELFFLWHGPDRDYVILYMHGRELDVALRQWVDHQGAFELWGKDQWTLFSDPSDWPDPLWAEPGDQQLLPELLSAYDEHEEQ